MECPKRTECKLCSGLIDKGDYCFSILDPNAFDSLYVCVSCGFQIAMQYEGDGIKRMCVQDGQDNLMEHDAH